MEAPPPLGCVSPPGGWLYLQIVRCANLHPIDTADAPAALVQCSCWVASWPALRRSTSSVRCDEHGRARWAEELWIPLPGGPSTTLRFELRYVLEWNGCLPSTAASSAKNGVTRGCGSIELSQQGFASTWCLLEGTGVSRSDGMRLGAAEVLVAYKIWAVRLQPPSNCTSCFAAPCWPLVPRVSSPENPVPHAWRSVVPD